MKLLPVPAAKLLPPLVLKVQVAPASRPVTFTVPVRVMPSLVLLPVSAARASDGAAALASTTRAVALPPTALMLPATSVWRTCTALAA